ncbi:MAG: hypothetical protein LLF75_12725 [Eubacteriales bacterium]|nr:hypothetical protein [Eubacteriales bacterium]
MLLDHKSGADQLVTAKRRLTTDSAVRIAKMFPPVRFEWLMGYDDFKTLADKKISELRKPINEGNLLLDAVTMIAYTAGYEIVLFDKTEESGLINIDDALKNIKEGYKIYRGGKMVATCSLDRFNGTANEIFDFAKFMIQKLVGERDETSAK